jgi:hypothetical protein
MRRTNDPACILHALDDEPDGATTPDDRRPRRWCLRDASFATTTTNGLVGRLSASI